MPPGPDDEVTYFEARDLNTVIETIVAKEMSIMFTEHTTEELLAIFQGVRRFQNLFEMMEKLGTDMAKDDEIERRLIVHELVTVMAYQWSRQVFGLYELLGKPELPDIQMTAADITAERDDDG